MIFFAVKMTTFFQSVFRVVNENNFAVWWKVVKFAGSQALLHPVTSYLGT